MTDDRPNCISNNGNKTWYKDGELHRDNDLPAIEHSLGNQWFINGERHRDNDKPAIEYTNGGREWYVNGELHRDNGKPAIEYASGCKEWYDHGTRVDRYYPDFGCVVDEINTREQALKRLNRKDRPYSRALYIADIDERFPRINIRAILKALKGTNND